MNSHIGVPRLGATADGLAQFQIHATDLVLIHREPHLAAARAGEAVREALLDVTRRLGQVRVSTVRLSPDALRLTLLTVGSRTALTTEHAYDRDRRLAILRALMPLLPGDQQEAIRHEVAALIRARRASRRSRRA